ncbi:hypothetical protein AL035_17775 [Salipiger aestuarii]|uniref:DUF3168 domain-containing protein n=1 Tax=Salipiger aestuarii TaxID=568098 RepID=A0A327YW34_9RHOB|nr:hypothetical protein [Salipiger aestuarii]KAB2539659.1 hypothetical protein AL035_17775 [Salipiger aestuarii]RAK24107.1 hypothetical protein ATI53_1001214 [Salipiger aestuarii]
MPSPHEAPILALLAAIDSHAARVMREHDLPVACPDEGLINLVPGDSQEEGVRLGAGTREWSREIDCELVVRGSTAAARADTLDVALVSLSALVLADRQLGGAVDWIEVGAPQQTDAVPMQGAETLAGAVLPVTIFYETTENPME